MAKKLFWLSCKLVVWIAFGVTAILLSACAAPAIAQFFGVTRPLNNGHIPIEVVSWCWMAILSAYTVGNDIEQFIASKSMPKGKYDVGDLQKLQKLIIASVLLLLYACLLNIVFAAEIGLEGFVMAAFSGIACYVTGTKFIKTAKYVDGFDVNGDGKVDTNDDTNGDGVIDWQDLYEFYRKQGNPISEEKAKELAQKMLGENGEVKV